MIVGELWRNRRPPYGGDRFIREQEAKKAAEEAQSNMKAASAKADTSSVGLPPVRLPASSKPPLG